MNETAMQDKKWRVEKTKYRRWLVVNEHYGFRLYEMSGIGAIQKLDALRLADYLNSLEACNPAEGAQ